MIEILSRDALDRIQDDFGKSEHLNHEILLWLWSWAEDEWSGRFRAEYGKLTRCLPEVKDVTRELGVLSTHIRRYEKEDSAEATALVRFLSCIRNTMIDENEKEKGNADD